MDSWARGQRRRKSWTTRCARQKQCLCCAPAAVARMWPKLELTELDLQLSDFLPRCQNLERFASNSISTSPFVPFTLSQAGKGAFAPASVSISLSCRISRLSISVVPCSFLLPPSHQQPFPLKYFHRHACSSPQPPLPCHNNALGSFSIREGFCEQPGEAVPGLGLHTVLARALRLDQI